MAEEKECMCLECGVSTYLPLVQIFLEDPASTEARLLSDLCICAECGGRLLLVGRAGDEPDYRTGRGRQDPWRAAQHTGVME